MGGLSAGLRTQVSGAFGLVRDTATRRYAPAATSVVIAVAASLAYLISPVDAIPDAIPVFGLMDDAAVLCAVFGGVAAAELARYSAWASEQAQGMRVQS